MRPVSKEAYELFHQGALALADIEANGMRMDVDLLNSEIERIGKKIRHLENKLKADKFFRIWQREFGRKSNLNSLDQIVHVLYNVMGYKCKVFSKSGKPSASEKALEGIDLPFVRRYRKRLKYQKLKSTYLEGFRNELVGEYIHGFINLHLVRTYRSSMSMPNGQNIPVRDGPRAKIIRSCFIPRKGFKRASFDFKSIEVNVAACYCKDPVLIRYCKDPTTDMHRDMAMKCFKLTRKQLGNIDDKAPGGKVRYVAKNRYVFPGFYGSYWFDTSAALWEAMEKFNLTTADGTPLREHLKKLGIRKLGTAKKGERPVSGTFQHYIATVDDWYWNDLYVVYTSWKKRLYEKYLKEGGFNTLTGFRVEGIMGRNKVLNNGIQGSASHLKLQTLIWMNRWLKKKKMKSVIIGEIHDSVEMDIHPKEEKAIFAKMKNLVEVRLAKKWDWIIVPLRIEVKISEVDGNWHAQQRVKL